MLLFKRILNFKDPPLDASDKRSLHRYVTGNPFPFSVCVNFIEQAAHENATTEADPPKDWSVTLLNLSHTGAGIELDATAGVASGQYCILKVSLDHYALEIPATIAHCDLHEDKVHCGIAFIFSDFQIEQAYLQLLEPVSIGASLLPVDPATVEQDMKSLRKEQHCGTLRSQLTIWRLAAKNTIYSFDFRMNDYGVRWSDGMAEVEPYGVVHDQNADGKSSPPFLRLTAAQLDEVRWLFCLAVPNLSLAVPPDVRNFLTSLVVIDRSISRAAEAACAPPQ